MKQFFLVKSSNGEILTFFYDKGLCYKNHNETNQLLKNVINDFDIVIDENDMIYMACQDLSGNILYVVNEKSTWKKQVILQSKTANSCEKYLRLCKISKFINLFYILQYEQKGMLVHHILENKPEVVDYVDRNVYDFTIHEQQKIFIFYRDIENKRICYRRYDWSQKSWNEKRKTELTDVSYLRVICSDDEFHVIFKIKTKLYYQKYETYDGVELIPAGNRIFITDDPKLQDAILLNTEHDLYILWDGTNGACTVSSPDHGSTFSIPHKLPYVKYTALYRLRGFSDQIILNETYGYELNGKLNLLAQDRFLIPEVSKRNVKYVSATSDVEKFAGIKQNQMAENTSMLEINKLKIRLSNLENQIERLNQVISFSPENKNNGRTDFRQTNYKEKSDYEDDLDSEDVPYIQNPSVSKVDPDAADECDFGENILETPESAT